MSNITTQQKIKEIKELRDATGIPVMQCKRALEEAEGDTQKAIAILKKNSSDIASKKSNKEVSDGSIMVKLEKNKLAMVVLQCETDFVAKNENFISLLNNLVEYLLSNGVESLRTAAPEMINTIIQKTGENIKLGEVCVLDIESGNSVGYYIHNSKYCVIVVLEGGTSELARNIAMHVTAMKPEYISQDEINDEAKRVITEVFEKEVANVNKPEEIKKKMLLGKLNTYFKEKTLLDQQFIKNPNETIFQLLEKEKAKIKEVKRYFI